jgi:hypothetical protein
LEVLFAFYCLSKSVAGNVWIVSPWDIIVVVLGKPFLATTKQRRVWSWLNIVVRVCKNGA